MKRGQSVAFYSQVSTFHAYWNVVISPFQRHCAHVLSSEVSQKSKSGYFCPKLIQFQTTGNQNSQNARFKTRWAWALAHPHRPTKLLSKRWKQPKQKRFNLWQDHLCGLPLGQMPDWPAELGFYSQDTRRGLPKTRLRTYHRHVVGLFIGNSKR